MIRTKLTGERCSTITTICLALKYRGTTTWNHSIPALDIRLDSHKEGFTVPLSRLSPGGFGPFLVPKALEVDTRSARGERVGLFPAAVPLVATQRVGDFAKHV